MSNAIQRALHQDRPFPSLEAEVFVGLQLATARQMDPWARHLRTHAGLTPNQYNVLRILRGAHPGGLTCGAIIERLITRDPDVSRLTDRLVRAGLASRAHGSTDRRVVEVTITPAGLTALHHLDRTGAEMLRARLGVLGPTRLQALRDLLGDVITAAGGTEAEPVQRSSRTHHTTS